MKVSTVWILLMSSVLPIQARASWSVYETARDNGHRLEPVPVLAAGASQSAVIRLDPTHPCQVMEGFGGALTEASGFVLAKLPEAKRVQVLRDYYDPKTGLGYTLARTHINSCDFSVSSWALDDTPGDKELKHFSLDPMRRWTMEQIRIAQRVCGPERFRLLASPWSPPAWMKTNNNMLLGGQLREDCREAWAAYFVKFVQAMKTEEGIPVWALTVQNEPEAKQTWESCLYNPQEEAAFVREHLGPALEKAGLGGIHLLGLDHNRDLLEGRAKAMLGDPATAKYLWGLGVHWYVSEDFEAASRVHAAFPEKHLLFTEGCLEAGAKPGDWSRGERYARHMIMDFRNWMCGFIDWNIALDVQGGPNHVGNFCDAPVLVDTAKGEVIRQNSFYYIGQFSRFVATGARRLPSEGGPTGLLHVAFQNPDGSLVLVVLNSGEAAVQFRVEAASDSLSAEIPAHAIQTYLRSKL